MPQKKKEKKLSLNNNSNFTKIKVKRFLFFNFENKISKLDRIQHFHNWWLIVWLLAFSSGGEKMSRIESAHPFRTIVELHVLPFFYSPFLLFSSMPSMAFVVRAPFANSSSSSPRTTLACRGWFLALNDSKVWQPIYWLPTLYHSIKK